MSSRLYTLKVKPKFESKAVLLWGMRKTKRFVVGAGYTVELELENVGQNDFPGGKAKYTLTPAHGMQRVTGEITLPPVRIGNSVTADEKIDSEVLGSGFTLLFCEIEDNKRNPAMVLEAGGQPRESHDSVKSFFAETRTEIYQLYALVVSALSLATLVFFNLLQLLQLYAFIFPAILLGILVFFKIKQFTFISNAKHFRRDLILIVFCIPFLLTLFYMLPSSVKDQLILYHDAPSLIPAYTTNFVHEEPWHFLGNLFLYLMFVIPIYFLSLKALQIRKFYTMLILILGPLPFLLSVVSLFIPTGETLLSLQTVKSLGFSGVVAAVLGFLPYFTLIYLKQTQNWKIGVSSFLNIILVLTFGLILLQYPETLIYKREIIVIVFAILIGLLFKAFRNTRLRECFSSAVHTFAKNRFFRVIPMTYIFFGLTFLVPENIRVGDGIVNINLHIAGLAFGFLVSYFFVAREKLGEP